VIVLGGRANASGQATNREHLRCGDSWRIALSSGSRRRSFKI